MGARAGTKGPARSGRVPGRWRALPDVAKWPFRQTVPAPAVPGDALAEMIEAAFRESGYDSDPGRPLAGGAPGYRPRGGPVLVAERDVRPAPLSRPKQVAALVLLLSGIGLGGVEAIVFGVPILAVPWILGSITAALLFAVVLNRAYDTDVVVAVPLVGPRPRAPGETMPRGTRSVVVFLGGQVRSEVFGRPSSGTRDAVRVSYEIHALRGLTDVARSFARRAAMPAPPTGPVPEVAPRG